MIDHRADNALKSSGAAFVVAVACIVLFLPPMLDDTVASTPRTVLTALVLCAAMFLHWIFLGIAASRLRRSVLGWVALAVCLFPVGGAVALVLLGVFRHDDGPHAAAAR
jgi:hypothetical protein